MTTGQHSISERWRGQKVVITGVCGTIGNELLRQVNGLGCEHIIGLDNSETELFFLSQEYAAEDHIELFLADIRDRDALMRSFKGTDIVLHAAALKHVGVCERSPRDPVATNILGIMNVTDAAEACKVERLIFTSSDKAVNPTNVMGTTKLMGERLITAANAHRRYEHETIFASTRFGNVLGSRGSVIPLFARQIRNGGPVTLTDEKMTRFIMTRSEAVSLVLDSVHMARGGEVFVTKMPVVRIRDLAEVMIDQLAPAYGLDPAQIKIRVIGAQAGEKLYEELISEEEIRRTVEMQHFFAIIPAFKGIYQPIDYKYNVQVSGPANKPYNSSVEKALTKDELSRYLQNKRVLEGVL